MPDPRYNNPMLPQWTKLMKDITVNRIKRKRTREVGFHLTTLRAFKVPLVFLFASDGILIPYVFYGNRQLLAVLYMSLTMNHQKFDNSSIILICISFSLFRIGAA